MRSDSRQLDVELGIFQTLLLNGRESHRLQVNPRRADDVHLFGDGDGQPVEGGHDVGIQGVQEVEVVDEDREDQIEVLEAPQEALEPVVDVERIEGGVLREEPLGKLQRYADLLGYDPEELQAVRGPRRRRHESHYPEDPAGEPTLEAPVYALQKRGLPGPVVAVDHDRAVPDVVRIVDQLLDLVHQVRVSVVDREVLVAERQMSYVLLEVLLKTRWNQIGHRQTIESIHGSKYLLFGHPAQ